MSVESVFEWTPAEIADGVLNATTNKLYDEIDAITRARQGMGDSTVKRLKAERKAARLAKIEDQRDEGDAEIIPGPWDA